MENKKTKIWLGDDGIVRLKIEKDLDEKIIERILLEFKKIAKVLPSKANVSIDGTTSVVISSSLFRKRLVETVKIILEDPVFNKIAEWGIKNQLVKTITLFIVGAINLKNFRYFDTEEKAVKWLKENQKMD